MSSISNISNIGSSQLPAQTLAIQKTDILSVSKCGLRVLGGIVSGAIGGSLVSGLSPILAIATGVYLPIKCCASLRWKETDSIGTKIIKGIGIAFLGAGGALVGACLGMVLPALLPVKIILGAAIGGYCGYKGKGVQALYDFGAAKIAQYFEKKMEKISETIDSEGVSLATNVALEIRESAARKALKARVGMGIGGAIFGGALGGLPGAILMGIISGVGGSAMGSISGLSRKKDKQPLENRPVSTALKVGMVAGGIGLIGGAMATGPIGALGIGALCGGAGGAIGGAVGASKKLMNQSAETAEKVKDKIGDTASKLPDVLTGFVDNVSSRIDPSAWSTVKDGVLSLADGVKKEGQDQFKKEVQKGGVHTAMVGTGVSLIAGAAGTVAVSTAAASVGLAVLAGGAVYYGAKKFL